MKIDADTIAHLDDLKGWDKLEQHEQQVVRDKTKRLFAAKERKEESELEIGELLTEVRPILQKRKMFLSWMKENFGFSQATGYRYIYEYDKARKRLPKPVLEIAMRRGYRPAQMKLLEENPPPKTTDIAKIRHHIDKLERMPREVKPEIVTSAQHPDTLLKECLNFVANRYDKLPHNTRTRTAWVVSLIGMLMTRFGWGSGQTFEPLAIPDGVRTVRGRPRQVA